MLTVSRNAPRLSLSNMNVAATFPSTFPLTLAALGWAALLIVVTQAAWQTLRPAVRANFLPMPEQQHAWLAGIVGLGVLWALQIQIANGLHLGMVGVPLYTLLCGRARATLGGVIALVGLTALTDRSWDEVGVTALLLIAAPAWITAQLQAWLATRLPHNVFIFMIGNGLFVNLIAAACASCASLALQMALAPTPVQAPGEIFGYALLLAWGEALACGMAFSALVIYLPGVVMTYAQDDYLRRP